MATPRTRLRLVLLQVRNELVSLRQEQSCFIERCRVARRQFRFINLPEAPDLKWSDVQDAHAVLIGGAGAFSVTREHPFTAPLREVVQDAAHGRQVDQFDGADGRNPGVFQRHPAMPQVRLPGSRVF